MSFTQFLRILWARRVLIGGCTLGLFLAGVVAVMVMPKKYEATTRVMLDVIKPDPVTGAMINNAFARAYTRTQSELIKDYRVTGNAVDLLGWANDPARTASYNARSASDTRDLRRYLADQLAANTEAGMIEGSNILVIQYTAPEPETAQKAADALRRAYEEQSLALKRESAARNADWFDGQVSKLREQLASAEERKVAYERANNIVLADDATDTETARLRALTAQAAVQGASAPTVAPPTASQLQLAQLDASIAQARETLGPNHPQIQALNRQREAVAKNAAEERAAVQDALRAATPPSLTGQVDAQKARVMQQREKVEALRRMQADVGVLRDQYTKSAARAADLRQESESNETGLTLLAPATVPEEPASPNTMMILFGALAAGLGLGLVSAVLLELFSRRVRGIEDLIGSDIPVVVVLPSPQRALAGQSIAGRLGWRGATS